MTQKTEVEKANIAYSLKEICFSKIQLTRFYPY